MWMRNVLDALHTLVNPIEDHVLEDIKDVVSLGCMAGSAVGSLVLLKSRLIWLLFVASLRFQINRRKLISSVIYRYSDRPLFGLLEETGGKSKRN
jgi:hypothetical protein